MSDQDTYLIHDNGGRPLRIVIDENNVSVHINLEKKEDNYRSYNEQPFYNFKANKIFIGKDRGPRPEDGNSILLHMRDNEYIYIGMYIYSFLSKGEIIEHCSPIGNSNVPYPYGIDVDGNYYLFIEDVVLINIGDMGEIITTYTESDPYNYYYWPKKEHPKASTEKINKIEVIQKRLW